MDEITVHVEADINPTEDEDKVKRAVENMFGNLDFEVETHGYGANLLVGKGKSREALTKLQNLLRRERIRDAARRALYEGLGERSLIFYLNKQVAYVDHVSFSKPSGESPLGPIRVEVQCNNPRELINWLTLKTS
jgi:predicted RNA binding protein with dsRBD fold (UPF0201 family)